MHLNKSHINSLDVQGTLRILFAVILGKEMQFRRGFKAPQLQNLKRASNKYIAFDVLCNDQQRLQPQDIVM